MQNRQHYWPEYKIFVLVLVEIIVYYLDMCCINHENKGCAKSLFELPNL